MISLVAATISDSVVDVTITTCLWLSHEIAHLADSTTTPEVERPVVVQSPKSAAL
jgi:hypothetical protein